MSAVHVRHWPSDPARPALAIHCMMGSGRAFDPMARRLGGKVDLTAFDLPSHGRSEAWRPAGGEDYHTTVTRIAEGLLGTGPVDLIGHSLGGTVALRLAVAAPQRVRSVTLIEPVLFAASRSGRALDSALSALAAAGKMEEAARLFLDVWGAPGGFEALPRSLQQAAVELMPLVLETDAALSADAHGILRRGQLEGVTAPTLLIAGADSPAVMGEILDALAARLPNARRATVPGAGHMVPVTHPTEVTELVAGHLDRS
ncbi:alpha/beta fold hydrolase [Paracoccus niistensis]|uniref:Alpha/beta fold hydrolase n=1 Tax=Paracoccus niistensis TaxID=632935 RepID=A0ABV6IAF7_9RHOB